MNNFVEICDEQGCSIYIDYTDKELNKKITEINRNQSLKNKFNLVLKSLIENTFNKTIFNFEHKCTDGKVYAIKVDNHRFYTLALPDGNQRRYFISRYGKKESQQNDKKLTKIIETVCDINPNSFLYEHRTN